MKVVADQQIPYIKDILTTLADEAVFLPGADFTPDTIRDADALIVRTRTRCNEALLKGSKVRFIGTATIGYDHINTDYCVRHGITWSNCPGCNARSVEQYVHSALLLLQREKGETLADMTLGVVGVGHVGTRIVALGERLGMRVLRNDPPRAERGEKDFVSLEEIAHSADIVTFHTPLTVAGVHATYHLANRYFFDALQRRPYIINTSRGEVVDGDALKAALFAEKIKDAVIDVWENEPDIDRELLQRVFIGTPHIAGYSADGKANATRMVLEAFCRHFGLSADFEVLPPALPTPILYTGDERFLAYYNPHTDSKALKAEPERFEQFRSRYPLRREPEE